MNYEDFAATQQPTDEEVRRARGDVAQACKSSGFRARVQAAFNKQHDPAAAAAQALHSAIVKAGNFWQNDAGTQSRVYFNNVQLSERVSVDGFYDIGSKTWHAQNAAGVISGDDFGALVLKTIVKA